MNVMSTVLHEHDWAATRLGPIQDWSPVLRSSAEMVIAHGFPAVLLWGPELIQIYNDGYRVIIGSKHPGGLGQPTRECWPEVWHINQPIYERVLSGESLVFTDKLFPIARRGPVEDAWFNLCYSPVREDGLVAGILVTAFETTQLHRAQEERDSATKVLADNEQRFRAFVTASSDVVYRMSADWSQMRELDGRGFLADTRSPRINWQEQYLLSEEWRRVEPAIRHAIDTKTMFELEHRVHRANGTIGWTFSRAVPILDEHGEIVEWLGTAKDITARREADEKLKLSEADLAAELEKTKVLRNLSERLVSEESLPAIYEEILAAAIEITRADAGTVQVYDTDTKSLILLVTRGFSGRMTDHFQRVDATSHTACGIALRTGERTFLDFDEHDADEACLMHVEAGYKSAQATPLISRAGAPIGMVNTHWRQSKHRPSESQLRFLDLLARQAADLIEHRHAEKRVRDSEERLRQFGEASQDVLWIRSADTLQWQYLTPAFETIYGLSRNAVLSGDNHRSWIDLIVPEDRQIAELAMERVRRGEHVTFDYRIRRPVDGTIRWLRNTDFPIVDGGGTVSLIGGIGHDLTELRETERRLTTLMEGIPQLVWRSARGGLWTWSSPQWTQFTGLSSDASVGRRWLDALHPDDRATAMRAWEQANCSGQQLEMECRIRHAASGQYRWFQTRAAPVCDESGTIIEWLGTSTDIDEVRELQERQHVLVAELQHRTRNLIGVVRALSDKTARTSTDLADYRTRFRHRLDALARVQGLLSRLNEHDRVMFDELIHTELSAMAGGVDRVTLAGPPGIRLRSSTVQTLAMALHELATNAVKYGALKQRPGGRLSITWSLQRANADEEPWLHIDWQESGLDMPLSEGDLVRRGQGRELIEQVLPYQLGAKTSYLIGSGGVHCTICLPASASPGKTSKHG